MHRDYLLEVKNLKKYFPIRQGLLRRVAGNVKAVDDVSFAIRSGETLGLVGESGCGKTTIGRCILRALDPTAGTVLLHTNSHSIDIAQLETRKLRPLRKDMQMIFQDPYSSLNPRMTVLEIVGEPLRVNKLSKGDELEDRVAELLHLVGLRSEYMNNYPHAFSGGQRQRISIARALSVNPKFLVCDEPVSALDVSIQAQILNLLQELQRNLKLTYLFISHDLSVVQHISDRVAVMYVGKLVELAETDELFSSPLHPYTEALLSAVPIADPDMRTRRIRLGGEAADPSSPPSGCYFHPRCRYVENICRHETPEFENLGSPNQPHYVACHLAEKLTLGGIA
ncbi:MAG: ATP-binding cassette domain-containing protein [Firmicutes bacterium]|nr:ATP-binding cassette domain-containing protein [Bacillota bacterium]